MISISAPGVPAQQAAPDLAIPDAPTVLDVTAPEFGRVWWQYLVSLAASEDRLAVAATAAELLRATCQQLLDERHGYHLAAAASARYEDTGKSVYPNDTTRNAAALALCETDECYQQDRLDLEEAQTAAARISAASDRARRARRDAHAFFAWATAYLSTSAAREGRHA